MEAGVYRIINRQTEKCYIGSTAKGLLYRWRQHQRGLHAQRHPNSHLQNAWNKYGADAFVFEVLLYCDPENCLMYEQVCLDHYKPEYNMALVAGSVLGIKRTDDVRMKFVGNKNPFYGKTHTAQSRRLMSLAKQGNKHPNHGKRLKDVTKRRISQRLRGSNNGRAKLSSSDITQIRLCLLQGNTYSDIAGQFNVSKSTIGRIARREGWLD